MKPEHPLLLPLVVFTAIGVFWILIMLMQLRALIEQLLETLR
jgi:hypothetical protein